jgi:hypothetical protein
MLNNKLVMVITDDTEPMKQKKSEAIYVKVSPEEKAKIKRNMKLTSIANISAFVRRMCLDGGVFKVDLPEIREVSRLMNITANNVNQLTKRVNGGGYAHRADVDHINEQLTECRTMFGKIMAKLAKF